MSLSITSAPEKTVPDNQLPEPTPNTTGAEYSEKDLEPIELREGSGTDIVLEALDIDEPLENLPEQDQENLKETKQYILDIINKRGDSPTMGAFKQTLNDIKAEFGLSNNADPSTILSRIGGVVKAWKNLSFVTSPQEKRRLFMKLARSNSSSEMNKIVFDEMERYQVWQ